MVSPSKQRTRHVATKTTGVYYSVGANGRKTFECRYTAPDGRRVFEAVGSFEAAKSRLAEVTGKLGKGEVVGNASTTVAALIKDWEVTRERVKPRTRETQSAHVRLYILKPLGRARVRDINRAAVVRWLNGLKRHDGKGQLSEGTRALILATLSSILDYAVLDDLIASNPCKSLGRKDKPRQGRIEDRILGPGEFDDLLGACKRFAWLRPIIQTTVGGALRLGEVVGLDWRDVDFELGVLVVRQNYGKDGNIGTPKGGTVEEIPLSASLRKVLAEHKLAAKDTSPDAPVFVNKIDGRRRPNEVERAFTKARAYAGLSVEPRALRFHDLRHSTITTLARTPGIDLKQVQSFARHKNLVTTLGYIHEVKDETFVDRVDEALAAIL
jgi:integrase